MAGRPRKPTGNNKKHLTNDEKDLRNESELMASDFPALSTTPPKWLDDDAKREYKRVVVDLKRLHITKLDQTQLSLYCNAYSKYIMASQDIDERGLLIEDKKNPSVNIMTDMSKEIRATAGSLGMTLDSRMKLVVPQIDKQSDDPFAKFGDLSD